MAAESLKAWLKARREAHRQRLARQPDVSGNAHRILGTNAKDPGDISHGGDAGGGVGGGGYGGSS